MKQVEMTTQEKFGLDIEVSYEGFRPTHQQRWLIDAYLTKISQKCPAHSFVSAKFILSKNLYLVEVLVQSFQNSFSSWAKDSDLQDCMILIEKKLISQLRPWKERRFGKSGMVSSFGQA